MAKSKKTKGGSGKRSQSQPETAKQTKKQLAASRRISKQNRNIYIGLGVVALIILAVLAFGVIQELVVKPATPVGRVNGAKIAKDDFEDLLQLRRYTTHVNIANLQDQLQGMDFVFLCLDGGGSKRMIVEKLEAFGLPFIDVGMGVELVDEALLGCFLDLIVR